MNEYISHILNKYMKGSDLLDKVVEFIEKKKQEIIDKNLLLNAINQLFWIPLTPKMCWFTLQPK